MASRHPERYAAMLVRLRQARKDADFTQIGAAEALGTTQSFISKVERGERRIDPVELQELADLYRRRIGFFTEER